MAHTPGPWVFETGPHDEPDFKDSDFIIAEERGYGEVVATIIGPIRLGTTEANARLIAAAPRMYDRIAKLAADGDVEAAEILEAVRGRS